MSTTYPSRNMLMEQPPEILDSIVCQISAKKDLLSFGLAAKFLASIVFPRHTQYHTVSAPLHSVAIWKHFISNRACARYVRRVQLVPDDYEDYGSWGPNQFQVEDCPNTPDQTAPVSTALQVLELEKWRERFFVLALHNMPYLRAFAWRRSSPPFILDKDNNIWSILRRKQVLVDVRLFENWSTTAWYEDLVPLAEQLGICSTITSPVSKVLHGLTQFEFKIHSWQFNGPTNIISVLDSLVCLCPSLEVLVIEVRIPSPRPAAKALLRRGRWPNLRNFQLKGFDLTAPQITSMELEQFLTFHNRLSHLILHSERYGDIPRIQLPPNSLPDLASVCVDEATLRAILSCPCTPPRKVREITRLRLISDFLDGSANNFQGLDRDSVRAVTVTEVCGSGDMQRLAALFPGVEYIDMEIDFDAPTWDEEAGTMRVLLIAEWAEKISALRNLRVLRGVPFFSDSHHETEEDRAEKIQGLAMWFPRLEWFSVPFVHSRVDIVRGADGVTWRIT